MYQANSETRNIKVLVVGAGAMGVRHIEACVRLNFQSIAIVDTDTERLRQVASQYGLNERQTYLDIHTALRNFQPNAVVVATTANAHCDLVQASAQFGSPYILCEKPMATSVEDCDAMLRACEHGGSRLAINHLSRYLHKVRAVKALLAEDELGSLRSMSVVAGAIGLAMGVSHILETFRLVSGLSLNIIQFIPDKLHVSNPRGVQFHDPGGRLIGENPNGARLFVDFGNDQGHGLSVTYATSNSQIRVDEINRNLSVSKRQPNDNALPTTRYGTLPDFSTTTFPADDLVEATMLLWRDLLIGQDFPNGVEGRLVVEQLAGAEFSGIKQRSNPLVLSDVERSFRFPWA